MMLLPNFLAIAIASATFCMVAVVFTGVECNDAAAAAATAVVVTANNDEHRSGKAAAAAAATAATTVSASSPAALVASSAFDDDGRKNSKRDAANLSERDAKHQTGGVAVALIRRDAADAQRGGSATAGGAAVALGDAANISTMYYQNPYSSYPHASPYYSAAAAAPQIYFLRPVQNIHDQLAGSPQYGTSGTPVAHFRQAFIASVAAPQQQAQSYKQYLIQTPTSNQPPSSNYSPFVSDYSPANRYQYLYQAQSAPQHQQPQQPQVTPSTNFVYSQHSPASPPYSPPFVIAPTTTTTDTATSTSASSHFDQQSQHHGQQPQPLLHGSQILNQNPPQGYQLSPPVVPLQFHQQLQQQQQQQQQRQEQQQAPYTAASQHDVTTNDIHHQLPFHKQHANAYQLQHAQQSQQLLQHQQQQQQLLQHLQHQHLHLPPQAPSPVAQTFAFASAPSSTVLTSKATAAALTPSARHQHGHNFYASTVTAPNHHNYQPTSLSVSPFALQQLQQQQHEQNPHQQSAQLHHLSNHVNNQPYQQYQQPQQQQQSFSHQHSPTAATPNAPFSSQSFHIGSPHIPNHQPLFGGPFTSASTAAHNSIPYAQKLIAFAPVTTANQQQSVYPVAQPQHSQYFAPQVVASPSDRAAAISYATFSQRLNQPAAASNAATASYDRAPSASALTATASALKHKLYFSQPSSASQPPASHPNNLAHQQQQYATAAAIVPLSPAFLASRHHHESSPFVAAAPSSYPSTLRHLSLISAAASNGPAPTTAALAGSASSPASSSSLLLPSHVYSFNGGSVGGVGGGTNGVGPPNTIYGSIHYGSPHSQRASLLMVNANANASGKYGSVAAGLPLTVAAPAHLPRIVYA